MVLRHWFCRLKTRSDLLGSATVSRRAVEGNGIEQEASTL
jgi:hypothetical protein